MSQVFHPWDWVIVVATMVASIGIGLYYRFTGGRQKTNEEYLMADRNMSIFPVAVSLMASFMSSITLLGVSSENFYYGSIFVVINIAYGLATPIITQLYLPVFYGLQKTSGYEYLELRFGPKIRMIASLTYTLQMVLYNGIVLYAPAIVIEAVTGLDRLVSILSVGLVCTFYTTLGGMKAALITDLLQSLLMLLSVFIVLIHGSMKVGGLGNVFRIAMDGGRMDFLKFSLDPTVRHTWWSLIIGGMCTYISLYGVNQTQVQKLLTLSTLNRSRMALWVSWPVLSVLSITTCLCGLAMYAVYHDCDPFSAGEINSLDQLLPYYVVNALNDSPGLLGLFVAGIFSGSLSTISSACNSLAAVTVTDYVGRWCKVRENVEPWLTKLLACGYGLLILGITFLAELLGGVLQAALTIFGAVGGPLWGVFTLGMFTTYATETGSSVGLLSALAFTLWISFGGPRPSIEKLPLSVEGCPGNLTNPEPVEINPTDYMYLYRISYMYIGLIGFLWVILVGSLVSLCTKKPEKPLDPALFTPFLANRIRRLKTEMESSHVKE
ncbi:Putative sodium-dependent multivitamin transporter [Eumeta japonica]|uniref:Sodium-dependent multivitamin transporter n=1 Tax=Eumeta variegata TaxID=151549 RepID=A0A4C1XPB6_EUMVA|nr:Putative sodium-dependent multivitamin transporter [Eumeta japonica]